MTRLLLLLRELLLLRLRLLLDLLLRLRLRLIRRHALGDQLLGELLLLLGLLLLRCFCFLLISSSCFWSGFAGLPSLTLTSSGPFAPGAEALGDQVVGLARGRALRQLAVVRRAQVEVSTGSASTTRMATPATSERHGRATTPRAQRAQPCGWWSSGCVRPSFTRSELIRGPSAPRSAGSSVVAASTATTTATAAL